MKIKTKLLTFIGGSIILLLAIAFSILIYITSDKIRKKLHDQLDNQTISISKQVEDLITTSAKSYLTAVGDESYNIAETFYELYKNGELSKERSMEVTLNTLTSFKFLKSGIIYITDDTGIIIAHPDKSKIDTISPVQAWIQRLQPSEKIFKEYEYSRKNKIVYRVYNKKYNFNICVSAYTSEFLYAVDMEELNKTMNTIKIGNSGYPFLLRKDGLVLTEPNKKLRNSNVYENVDAENNKIYKKIIEEEHGYFTYRSFEPNGNIKEKFIAYKTESDSELIIVLTGYSHEIYDTVNVIITFIIILGLILIVLLVIVIYAVASTVTNPIIELTRKIADISHGDGDLTQRIKIESKDEIGIMVQNFNYFLDTLQTTIGDIKHSISATSDIKDKITYRVLETSASVKKISSNIKSIKNHTKQIGKNNKDDLLEYLMNSMDLIAAGSGKISRSMERVTVSSIELELNGEKLKRRVQRFKT